MNYGLTSVNLKQEGNTVGSSKHLVGNTLAEYKKSLVLTPLQQEILIGSILGDGNLRVIKRDAHFTVSQGEAQKEYVFWKYQMFHEWVLTPPTRETRRYYKDSKRVLTSWRWSTVGHPVLTGFHKLFYPFDKKSIPQSIDTLLCSPRTLAVWYMDDGSRKPYGKGAFLHTECFSVKDQLTLIDVLKKNFGLENSLASAGLSKGQRLYRIYIHAKSFLVFRQHIWQHMLPLFHYKLVL